MYLYLGGDMVVPEERVIAVFDIESASISRKTRDFLARAQKEGRVVYVTEELPKSFALVEEDGIQKVYILQIASATLKKRVGVL